MVTIKVGKNKYEAQLVGRGTFSRVYRVEDKVYAYHIDPYFCDPTKEIFSKIKNIHFTNWNWVGYYKEEFNIYEGPYLEKRLSKKEFPAAWNLFNYLSLKWKESRNAIYEKYEDKSKVIWYQGNFIYNYGSYVVDDFIEKMEDDCYIPETMKEGFNLLRNWVSSYGSGMFFEFAKRNCRIDKENNLVFLDLILNTTNMRKRSESIGEYY